MIMSRLYSPIGRRHRVATSALVGAIGIFLSAAAAPAETTYSAASGVETVAQAPVTSSPGAAAATATAADTSIRPFHIRASDEALADLRRRIAATKWPKQKTVTDASQGVQLATMGEFARHWEKDYDWRKVESTLNASPQFTTNIDGVEIHFIHVLIALSRARCVSIASNRT
jgi:hypothetical protein